MRPKIRRIRRNISLFVWFWRANKDSYSSIFLSFFVSNMQLNTEVFVAVLWVLRTDFHKTRWVQTSIVSWILIVLTFVLKFSMQYSWVVSVLLLIRRLFISLLEVFERRQSIERFWVKTIICINVFCLSWSISLLIKYICDCCATFKLFLRVQ